MGNKKKDKPVEKKSPYLQQYNWRMSSGEIPAHSDSSPKAEKDKREAKYDKIAKIASLCIVFGGVIALILTCCYSCEGSGNPDDHSGEHWIWLILLLVCFFKIMIDGNKR